MTFWMAVVAVLLALALRDIAGVVIAFMIEAAMSMVEQHRSVTHQKELIQKYKANRERMRILNRPDVDHYSDESEGDM